MAHQQLAASRVLGQLPASRWLGPALFLSSIVAPRLLRSAPSAAAAFAARLLSSRSSGDLSLWDDSGSSSVSAGGAGSAGGATGASSGCASSHSHHHGLRPPRAKQVRDKVFFGLNLHNPGEFRGSNPMNPPQCRIDLYHWMRDDTRSREDVLTHLKAENEYTAAMTAAQSALQEEIYADMLSHLKETDVDVPHRHGPFLYYYRTVQGLSYKIHCRKAIDGPDADREVVVLDENKLAEGLAHCDVSSYAPSPSHKLVAYGVDTSGYETYAIRIIRSVKTGDLLEDTLEGTTGEIAWGADDSVLFYMTMDAEHRPNALMMHELGTPQSADALVLGEADALFWMHFRKTADEQFLVVGSDSKETSENYLLSLQGLQGAAAHRAAVGKGAACVQERRFGLRYQVEHHNGSLYLVTNADGAKNNKLCRVSAARVMSACELAVKMRLHVITTWEDVVAYNPAQQIDEILVFKRFLAIFGRENGTQRLWIMNLSAVPPPQPESAVGAGAEAVADHMMGRANTGGSSGSGGSGGGGGISRTSSIHAPTSRKLWKEIPFAEQTYSVWSGSNFVYDSDLVRFGYSSFITPKQVVEYNVRTDKLEVLKETEVPGYDRSCYESRRLSCLSHDGRSIPVSLVYHRKTVTPARPSPGAAASEGGRLENLPLLLYGYGSYGACMDPTFDFKRSALLDRGVVYAVAHIRGGGEMGRHWYEDEGKYLTKRNTFRDFIDVAKLLVVEGITSSDRLAIVGRSAGGLLMGAVVNEAPELFKAVVADVPFVDVVNTMSDPTIPLTVTEWEEWGNPNEEKYYDYMLSYSPYDNVKEQAYPAMLVTAGLNDPRVPYWEPAKLVAKLREKKTDSNPLLLKTDMSSGHFSASDRYKFIRESAFEASFILSQLLPADRLRGKL